MSTIAELHHRSLKSRFRSAIAGTLLKMPIAALETLPDAIAKVMILPNSASNNDVLTAILIGLYQHQNLRSLPIFFTELEPLVLSYIIALSCRDALNPKTLAVQIESYLQQESKTTDYINQDRRIQLSDQFKLAQHLADQGQSKAIALSLLGGESLAFGLYCFLSTPKHWYLATQRAGLMHSELSAAIGGIVAAYQGNFIPPSIYPYSNDAYRSVVEVSRQQADFLLDNWSGVSKPPSIGVNPAQNAVTITAPDITGRRL